MMAVCMAFTLLAVPAGAASAGFSDVTDSATAVDVECLRLMGVLDGYADGSFRPGVTLNRAQFCKMAVYAQNAQKELGKYRTVTVFPDVKPSHWAASYINLASKGKGIILGFADGKFHPENPVTAGQAVTILMRQLGYKDGDVGAVWPDGYLAEAAVIGLTEGLQLTGSAPLTRGQAARLFVNLLRCDKADGTSYAAGIAARVEEHTMLVSSTATAPDGTDTAMQIGNGMVYQMSGKTSTGLLNGRMGTLLLDEAGKVMTFVPDAVGSSRIVVVSTAAANQLTDTSGQKYALTGDTAAYYNGEETTWSKTFSWLTAGTSVTLYLGSTGGVEYVFVGSGSTATQAVIVYDKGSTAGFSALTGGSTNYKIVKNGAAADAGDLRAYDVATYSSATNTIRVCDVRLSGIYESCSPSPSAPDKITVMGHEFNVLPSAVDMLAKLKVGSALTLLLTEDNQVAGAVSNEGNAVRGNALGIVRSTGASARVDLLCGITVTGEATGSAASQLQGQLVRVSSGKAGSLTISRLTGGVSGDLDVVNRKLGDRTLADNVVIFRSGAGGLEAVSLSQLTSATVPKGEIRYAGTDWAGRISVLVLGDRNSITNYIYGRAIVRNGESMLKEVEDKNGRQPGDDGYISTWETVEGATTIAVEYGNGQQVGPVEAYYNVRNGAYVRASVNAEGRFTSMTELTKVANVANSAWVGQNAVTVSGRTYTVASDISCYNASTKTWVTLAEAHAFAPKCNLYVDGGGAVRVIEVSQ